MVHVPADGDTPVTWAVAGTIPSRAVTSASEGPSLVRSTVKEPDSPAAREAFPAATERVFSSRMFTAPCPSATPPSAEVTWWVGARVWAEVDGSVEKATVMVAEASGARVPTAQL